MEWMPIETAPKDGTHVLIRYFKGEPAWRRRVCGTHSATPVVTEAYNEGYGWSDAIDRLIMGEQTASSKNKVTHWMPLPEEPA
jgi:hypothetical protein